MRRHNDPPYGSNMRESGGGGGFGERERERERVSARARERERASEREREREREREFITYELCRKGSMLLDVPDEYS